MTLEVPEKFRKKGISQSMVNNALELWGDSVKGIEGLWNKSSTNTKILNDALADGKSLLDAIFYTPTGRIAEKNGFDSATLMNFKQNDDGTYSFMNVIFEKQD